jgi:DNA-directed RNA polymerase subunit RPC12/RpoP
MEGGAFLVLLFFFGLSAGIIGKIKGSSFFIWFLVGFVLPVIGTIAAVLFRFERAEPRRQCPECGKVMPLHSQVCMRCGRDLDFPSQASEPAISGR